MFLLTLTTLNVCEREHTEEVVMERMAALERGFLSGAKKTLAVSQVEEMNV